MIELAYSKLTAKAATTAWNFEQATMQKRFQIENPRTA